MRSRTLGITLVALAAVSPAFGAATVKHSGRIVAMGPGAHTITLEEVGPWAPDRDGSVPRTVTLEPSTRIALVARAPEGAAAWPGGYTESPLAPADLKVGDYATVTVERAGKRLRALTVEVVRTKD